MKKRALLTTAGGLLLAALVVACSGGGDALDAEKVALGQQVYRAQCQACHGDADTGLGALPGIPVHSMEGHTWHHADGQLEQIILGRLNYPGRMMPSFEDVLTEEDVRAILTYFKSNWLPQQRASQAEASRNWERLQGSAS